MYGIDKVNTQKYCTTNMALTNITACVTFTHDSPSFTPFKGNVFLCIIGYFVLYMIFLTSLQGL